MLRGSIFIDRDIRMHLHHARSYFNSLTGSTILGQRIRRRTALPPKPELGSMFFRPRKDPKIDQPCINASPLNRRAWVTQERILSRRILHFSQGMIHWRWDHIFRSATGSDVAVWIPAPPRGQLLAVGMESLITPESFEKAPPSPISQREERFWRILRSCSGYLRSYWYSVSLWNLFQPGEMVPRQLLWMPCEKPLWYMGEAPSWSWAAYAGKAEIWDAKADFWVDSG
ncbi:hypothetical protein BDZ45DRAFT_747370 [Acephala macrosclerotiorum]|nr:hypothetical protein BDZ45DRAFT_747370 [Acephala macrosclerotiorum]